MTKPSLILLSGLVGCVVAFAVFYLAGTASSRELMREPQPELAWLKKEFNLNEEEYNRIVTLHKAYLPQCAERCRLIEEENAKLRRLMADSPSVTPQIESVMATRAKMRAECEAEMLKHFLEVSRTMPVEQGRRYLSWIEKQTILRGDAMEQQHQAATGPHHHH